MAGSPGASLRFPRSRRLKDRRDFARVRLGKRVVSGCLIANWIPSSPPAQSRLGVVTPKSVGNAPDRSRSRRLLREVFRVHQNDLTVPVDLVLVARRSLPGKTFAQVECDFITAMRIGKIWRDPS